jgi:hypothetical protein
MINLFLIRMTDANNGFLNRIGIILANRKPRLRRHQHRDAAGLAQLQGASAIFVHKRLLNSCGIRGVGYQHMGQLRMQRRQPRSQVIRSQRVTHTIRNMRNPRAMHLDHAPAHIPQTRIDS